MASLSEDARAAQQALRDASVEYQAIVDSLIENPQGQFLEKLREAEEHVAEAATLWALAYLKGAEPDSSGA